MRGFFTGRAYKMCALLAMFIITSCSATESINSDEYLVRVMDSIFMVIDFQREFETIRSACSSGEVEEGASFCRNAKIQLLNQIVEELIIIERGKELNISVTDIELEESVKKIKEDYPESEFENMLLEYSVSYSMWEKRLKTRLLIEKVVTQDLKNHIQITADDISKYYHNNITNNSRIRLQKEPAIETVVKNLRNLKAEEAYKAWFESLQKKYKVEINIKQWEKILSQ
jgi:hypothetical protein